MATAAGLLIAVILGGVVLWWLTGRTDDGQAAASPTSSASPSSTAGGPASEAPSPSAGPSEPLPPASESPAPPSGLPGSWTAAATFSEDGRILVVGDMVATGTGLLAVGTSYGAETFPVFGPPPSPTGRIWRSADGASWDDVTPADTFDGVELQHVFATSDGSLRLVGSVTDATTFTSEHRAWTSPDGVTWTAGSLGGVPAGHRVDAIEQGDAGYLLVAADSAADFDQLWHSDDGIDWSVVHKLAADGATAGGVTDIGAGPEGFVALVSRSWETGQVVGAVMASADGRTWFEGTMPSDTAGVVAPIGQDWLTIEQFGGDQSWEDGMTVDQWASANGLDWTSAGSATWGTWNPDPDSVCAEFPTRDVSVPGVGLFLGTTLTYACSEGGFQTAGGTWASIDGGTWERLPFGDHATIGAVETIGGRVAAAVHAGTGLSRDAGIAFWVGD